MKKQGAKKTWLGRGYAGNAASQPTSLSPEQEAAVVSAQQGFIAWLDQHAAAVAILDPGDAEAIRQIVSLLDLERVKLARKASAP